MHTQITSFTSILAVCCLNDDMLLMKFDNFFQRLDVVFGFFKEIFLKMS